MWDADGSRPESRRDEASPGRPEASPLASGASDSKYS